jgi:hypothetical protein
VRSSSGDEALGCLHVGEASRLRRFVCAGCGERQRGVVEATGRAGDGWRAGGERGSDGEGEV